MHGMSEIRRERPDAMNLKFEVLSDTTLVTLTKVGSWFHICTPTGGEWIHESNYWANHHERLTKVDRSSPTAQRDAMRQWRAGRSR